ncbi:Major facilitator superfamily MFS_1 [Oceanobacter sp. RED65]|uniref:Major facilitator superfamily MFS_1 n=2 Tax=Bermanella marisrubri TaxID=207949 RepID=Q1N6H6_9GAMM|nr:Major facilitator superfamily MFS_1 [Oceanobacter sp. RED65] [Bermanella marisrubri]
MLTVPNVPYWRLSSFYFFYFALLGCISPYWGLFLDERGFTAQQIGELMALFGLVRIIAPNVWGWLGDMSGRRMPLLRLGTAVCFLIFMNIFWVDGFMAMATIMIGYGFFWAAVLPQFEVITLNYLQTQTDHYSKIRIWGSIGFAVFVLVLGWVFDHISVANLPVFMLILLAAIFVSSLTVQGRFQVGEHDETNGFLFLVKHPAVFAFLLAGFLMQMSHGAYYTFFSLFLEKQGYSKSMIGFLWALGVVAEVLIFLVAHRLFAHVNYKTVLIVSLLLAAIRWWFIGNFSDVLWLLLIMQLLHAATFGTMHAVSMYYVHRFFKGRHQGQGQALFSSVTYGAGGALGAWIAGHVWGWDQGVSMFELAALSALLGAAIAWFGIRR